MHGTCLTRRPRPPNPVTHSPAKAFRPVQVLTMRCSAYEVSQEGGGWSDRFFVVGDWSRGAQWNGAESRAAAVWFRCRQGRPVLPGSAHAVFFKSVPFRSSFRRGRGFPDLLPRGLCLTGCRRARTCREVRPAPAPIRTVGGPTPMVSCLCDGGDRGLRPI